MNCAYLCLVSDEVNLWFGGLGWRRSWDHNIWLLFWFLNQHVHEGLLLILRLHRDDRSRRGWRGRCLDEDNLVVLLGRRHVDRLARGRVFVIRRGDVHVHMFVHYGLLGRAVLRSGRSIRRGWRRVGGRRSTVRRWGLRPRERARHYRRQHQRSQHLYTQTCCSTKSCYKQVIS